MERSTPLLIKVQVNISSRKLPLIPKPDPSSMSLALSCWYQKLFGFHQTRPIQTTDIFVKLRLPSASGLDFSSNMLGAPK